jgi:hypothetical protein
MLSITLSIHSRWALSCWSQCLKPPEGCPSQYSSSHHDVNYRDPEKKSFRKTLIDFWRTIFSKINFFAQSVGDLRKDTFTHHLLQTFLTKSKVDWGPTVWEGYGMVTSKHKKQMNTYLHISTHEICQPSLSPKLWQ